MPIVFMLLEEISKNPPAEMMFFGSTKKKEDTEDKLDSKLGLFGDKVETVSAKFNKPNIKAAVRLKDGFKLK